MKSAMQTTSRQQRDLHYDLATAVTFLLAGLGLGSLLTMLLSPLPNHSSTPVSSRLR
jgi:hypothetical protein